MTGSNSGMDTELENAEGKPLAAVDSGDFENSELESRPVAVYCNSVVDSDVES